MMNPLDRRPVMDWLARFDTAAHAIPEPRRGALRAELTGHLHDAIAVDADDAAVAAVLAELGEPGAIVDDEVDAAGAVEVEAREPVRRRTLATGAIVIIVIALLLAVGLPIMLVAMHFAAAAAATPPNVVTAHAPGPDKVTEGRAYEEYRAEIGKLPPLPTGAEWPDGVLPGMDAGMTDAGVVAAGNGTWAARFTWLCAWEDEYFLAHQDQADARLVTALDQLQWWADSDFWTEVDGEGGWEQNVLAPLQFDDVTGLKRDLPQMCGQAGIPGVYNTLYH